MSLAFLFDELSDLLRTEQPPPDLCSFIYEYPLLTLSLSLTRTHTVSLSRSGPSVWFVP
jgi:hypothetical protein